MLTPPQFANKKEYGSRFTHPGYWWPYLNEIARRHNLLPLTSVRPGLPGTHPVFLLNERRVFKLFSDLFSSETSFAVEREVYALLDGEGAFPAPRRLGEGVLFASAGSWRWPYLISNLIPGEPLVERYEVLDQKNKEEIARYLARWLKRLHHLPLSAAGPLRPDWAPFQRWLEQQREQVMARQRRWGTLPEHLLMQVEAYLPPVRDLLASESPPLLLHADLNADHLLGDWSDSPLAGGPSAGSDLSHGPTPAPQRGSRVWQPTGIIDFGDATVGDLLYELQALHIGLFRCDRRLLGVFLEAYDASPAKLRDFARRAMSFTLLHEFNLVETVLECLPGAAESASLGRLAALLWQLTD